MKFNMTLDPRIDNKWLCAFYDHPCLQSFSENDLQQPSKITRRKISYKNISICLKCKTLTTKLSNSPIMLNLLNLLMHQFLTLKQKIDLDQMILAKQKFSLDIIQKQTEDLSKEQDLQEREFKDRINKYKVLLTKRDIYLHTLKKLSNIIGQESEPHKIWDTASNILIHEIPDLEGVGLIIFEKNIGYHQKYYIKCLPISVIRLIEKALEDKDFFSKFMHKEAFLNLYQIYWEWMGNKKRLGPRTQEILERSFLLPIEHKLSFDRIFMVLMKDLTSPMEELASFFYTVAKFIGEGVNGNLKI